MMSLRLGYNKSSFSQEDKYNIFELYLKGSKITDIANKYNCSRAIIYKFLKNIDNYVKRKKNSLLLKEIIRPEINIKDIRNDYLNNVKIPKILSTHKITIDEFWDINWDIKKTKSRARLSEEMEKLILFEIRLDKTNKYISIRYKISENTINKIKKKYG